MWLVVVAATWMNSMVVIAEEPAWRAGAAKVTITPERPMWMSGYASRNHPAEGKLTDLWAKALVLEDDQGQRVAVLTLDLVGIDREFSLAVKKRVEERTGLPAARVAICCSHTHTGPVVGENLGTMYFLDDQQQQLAREYTAALPEKLVGVVASAVDDLRPARVTWTEGSTDFAVNRRNNREPEVPKLREQGALVGPVDHRVPVLAVHRADTGALHAVLFGYACHATTLSFYRWSGDYPGFAMLKLEEAHPGATALFFAGCGADQNPLPRQTVELARGYGEKLAAAVETALAGPTKPARGPLAVEYQEVDLPLGTLPTRDELVNQSTANDRYQANRAKRLLAQIDAGQPLAATYPYPVQSWRLDPELVFVTLGGEVVVDYALRLKVELEPTTAWIAGYTNDVMAYIPSRRVLAEGGYEGGGAMVYYGLPCPWAPEVEELIVGAVKSAARSGAGALPR
ncbi:MAG: neutral/alkaline non-lysosomal ceramidase N-terminal domain-containing protein [Pirellulales bacterium]|nr:neutral/alkaline non-lysosomal ceramidase N-terminal domain-containing protein [Pirellulales bacterium]